MRTLCSRSSLTHPSCEKVFSFCGALHVNACKLDKQGETLCTLSHPPDAHFHALAQHLSALPPIKKWWCAFCFVWIHRTKKCKYTEIASASLPPGHGLWYLHSCMLRLSFASHSVPISRWSVMSSCTTGCVLSICWTGCLCRHVCRHGQPRTVKG